MPVHECIESSQGLLPSDLTRSGLSQYAFYQSLYISYITCPPPPSWHPLSFITVTRDTDGVAMTLDGNLIVSTSGRGRFYSFTLLTGYSYTVSIQAPFSKPNFSTPNITVSYRDNVAACSEGVTLFFPPTAGGTWAISETSNVSPP